ncbi:MAG: septum formation family protein [Acidimicrobiia bacterium]|nr:septum formation family protein [Acidimicrobiia bacterium]
MSLSTRPLAVLLASLVVLGACTSSPDELAESPNAESEGNDTAEVEELDETVEPEWAGAPLNPFDLRKGQCFNEVSWIDVVQDRRIEITAAIDCDQPHDKEMYHEIEFPAPNGAPFPGETKMTEWSTERCFDAFEDFVGEEYVLSAYEIGFLQPTQETFEHPVGRHRRVTCYLYDDAGDKLTESAFLTAR